jgi:hypothetical protein
MQPNEIPGMLTLTVKPLAEGQKIFSLVAGVEVERTPVDNVVTITGLPLGETTVELLLKDASGVIGRQSFQTMDSLDLVYNTEVKLLVIADSNETELTKERKRACKLFNLKQESLVTQCQAAIAAARAVKVPADNFR